MEVEVKLPSLKETSGDEKAGDDATISFYFKESGDEIEEGEALVEMATDKATFEVPCPVTGVIKKISCEEDEVVSVGATLAVIETPD